MPPHKAEKKGGYWTLLSRHHCRRKLLVINRDMTGKLLNLMSYYPVIIPCKQIHTARILAPKIHQSFLTTSITMMVLLLLYLLSAIYN